MRWTERPAQHSTSIIAHELHVEAKSIDVPDLKWRNESGGVSGRALLPELFMQDR